MESTTSSTVSANPTYDPKFYAPVDLFEEAPSALGTSCHFEDTMPTLSNHPDMLMCPMYPSSEVPPPQHPLDPSSRHSFYLQNHPHQTSSTPTMATPYMHDYHLPSSASSTDLSPLDHCLAHPDSVPFPGHLEDFYGSCAQSSPSSYLQYLQQSPNKHQHYTLQPSAKAKADTTPLDILDPPTSIYGTNPMFSTNHPTNSISQNKQPSLSVSTLDLSHLTMDPNCPSSVEYMDSSKPSWMLDSLDNTYLPTTLDTSLDFYESDQNNENPFYLSHHPYLSHQMPSSMSSHSLPPSSSYQNEATNLSADCLPRGYVNLSDVNSFVAESDSIKHTTSFPHLSTSPSKCASGINGVPGDELQSLLGDISPATPSNNSNSNNCSSTFLSHSFAVPSYLNPQSGYSYSDSNESMDDLSDSDTTTSTQSWMIPFPQDPFFSWRDSSSTQSAASSFYPLGGLTSSMSTPVVGVGHPRPYDSHPYSHHHHHHHSQGNIVPSGDTIHDMTAASTMKRDKSIKKRSKQSQQQQPGKPRRSTSGMIHTGANARRKTSMSNIAKRKDLRRRESEPHSLSATYPSSSSVAMKSFPSAGSSTPFSPARLSVSTSISSLLSRQKLSDDEDEGTHKDEEDDDEDDEDDDSDQGVYLPQQYRLHQDNPFSQKPHRQHKDMEPKTGGLHYGELGPTSHPKKGRNVDKACNHCKRSHLRCDNMRPCRRCIATGKSGCKDVEHKPRGRPRLHNT